MSFTYDDIKDALKISITNCIYEAMDELTEKRYLRTSKLPYYAFIQYYKPLKRDLDTGDLCTDLVTIDGDVYKTPLNITGINIGASFLDLQYYFDQNNRILYIYYILDQNYRFGDRAKAVEIYKGINEKLDKCLSYRYNLTVEILGPADIAGDVHFSCNSQVGNKMLTADTFSIWVGLNGNVEFLSNRALGVKHKYKAYLDYAVQDFTQLNQFVEDINKKYNFFANPNENIPKGFKEYREFYKAFADIDLSVINEQDVIKMHILNLADFSFVIKKFNFTYWGKQVWIDANTQE